MKYELFILCLSLGFIIEVFVMARSATSLRNSLVLAGVVAAWTLAPYPVEVIISVVRGHPMQFQSGFIESLQLAFIFVFPFIGFIWTGLLQKVNGTSVLSMSLIFWYYVIESGTVIGSPVLLAAVMVLSGGALIISVVPFRLHPLLKLIFYSWYLAVPVLLALVELPDSMHMLGVSPDRLPGPVITVTGSMALVYILVNCCIALKFVLVLISCLLPQGRKAAFAFIDGHFFSGKRHRVPALVLVAVQAALFVLNYYYSFLDVLDLIELAIVVVPQVITFILYRIIINKK